MQFKIGNIVQLELEPSDIPGLEKSFATVYQNDNKAIAISKLHITLWAPTRDDKLAIQKLNPSHPKHIPSLTFHDNPHMIIRVSVTVGEKVFKHKRSWILIVKEQELLRKLVDEFATSCGLQVSEYERRRPFHISIANMTGSPFDSVGDVEWSDLEESHA